VTTFPEKKRQHQRVLSLVCLSSGSRRKYRQLKMVAGVHSIYRLADGGEPVARARRVKRLAREQSAERGNFPEAMLAHLSGLVLQTAVNP
ncbi:hypothetical protein, partial [Klebsiella michiganensis]|uniref:hypothetical protein n=1 Tax=Klebsiella michiganensis TaxID=1134687 RepID=UPI00391A1AFE